MPANADGKACDTVVKFESGPAWTRRGFLQTAALSACGVGCHAAARAQRSVDPRRACILILNVGGPSQLDTFDMKPDAPAEIRGPFRPIATRAPGIQISELLPHHAQLSDKFALVRSCCHDGPAVHDAGWQLMQTGRFFTGGRETPHAGAVAAYLSPTRTELPSHVVLPETLGRGGGNLPHGQASAFLGDAFQPATIRTARQSARGSAVHEAFDVAREPAVTQERYGRHRLGRCCLLARRLVERGARFVTVNAFSTVFGMATWDTHGRRPFTSLRELRDEVAPRYDQAYAALIQDLDERGLLPTTLVANLCEFGRTPRINADGGRDHWPRCFTVYFAGGGVRGGQVVGRSDALGGCPADRPVGPAAIVATVFHSLRIDLRTRLPGPHGEPIPLIDPGQEPIWELFG